MTIFSERFRSWARRRTWRRRPGSGLAGKVLKPAPLGGLYALQAAPPGYRRNPVAWPSQGDGHCIGMSALKFFHQHSSLRLIDLIREQFYRLIETLVQEVEDVSL
jgi:hypothetical protein